MSLRCGKQLRPVQGPPLAPRPHDSLWSPSAVAPWRPRGPASEPAGAGAAQTPAGRRTGRRTERLPKRLPPCVSSGQEVPRLRTLRTPGLARSVSPYAESHPAGPCARTGPANKAHEVLRAHWPTPACVGLMTSSESQATGRCPGEGSRTAAVGGGAGWGLVSRTLNQ